MASSVRVEKKLSTSAFEKKPGGVKKKSSSLRHSSPPGGLEGEVVGRVKKKRDGWGLSIRREIGAAGGTLKEEESCFKSGLILCRK